MGSQCFLYGRLFSQDGPRFSQLPTAVLTSLHLLILPPFFTSCISLLMNSKKSKKKRPQQVRFEPTSPLNPAASPGHAFSFSSHADLADIWRGALAIELSLLLVTDNLVLAGHKVLDPMTSKRPGFDSLRREEIVLQFCKTKIFG